MLIDTGALAERLQRHIDRLAAEHSAPTFQPHATLLGGTEQSEQDALRITAELASVVPVSGVSIFAASGLKHWAGRLLCQTMCLQFCTFFSLYVTFCQGLTSAIRNPCLRRPTG